MVTMDDISNAIILLVRVGAVARFVYCLVRLTAAEEQAAQYKKRARTKMMRKEEFEYDWMKMTADAARNLFSWNSKCAATPFEISRMPAPAIRALFTACFIANGDYMVSVRKNDKGEKVFEIDDSAGKRREAFNLQMEQMMEAPGMEPD